MSIATAALAQAGIMRKTHIKYRKRRKIPEMEVVSRDEFNVWEREKQVQYIKDVIGEESVFEQEIDGEKKMLLYGKVKIEEWVNEMVTRRSVRIYPYEPSKDKVISRHLLKDMEGISYIGSVEGRDSIRLEDSMLGIFEVCIMHLSDEDRRWPIVCRFYDDFGSLEALNDRLDKLRAQIAEAEAESEKLKTKLQEQQTSFQKVEAAMEKRRQDLDTEYEQKKAEAQADYEKTAAFLDQKIRAVQRIAGKYGLPLEELLPEDTENAEKEAAAGMGAKELTDYVWSYLWQKKGLQYDPSVVARFLDSLHTEQLTILWGEPGSGKTSLPQAVAEAIGAECRPVAVQPSWSDNHDLLGYYNALEDRYISTPFLESLVEANQHPDKLYLVVLDEMNLAHVEYYFSEVLSAMTRDDRALTLYGQTQNANLIRLLEIDEQGITAENCKEAKDICMKQLYPGKFRIPDNVRFIGTINMDETTKSLSPKVVDRSYAIRVGVLHNHAREELQEEVDALPKPESCTIPADSFRPQNPASLSGEALDEDQKARFTAKRREIQGIVDLFQDISAVSNRFYHYIDQILLWNPDIDVDWLIFDKILSAVRFDKNNVEDAEELEENLESKEYLLAREKLREMIEEVNDDQAEESYYWR